ncbi:fungal-specific transcription factor domain-containing protein [Xylariales sp. PMI_506]|nr:fungal-specific transcription factor domain-containing protein [Xylariales sp. PMI_506]
MAQQQDSQHKEPEARNGGAFRIWTADDFGTNLQFPKRRRTRYATAACEMCRMRKVKCVVSQPPPSASISLSSPCQQCKQLDLECSWDVVDKRKRKRKLAQASSQISTHKHLPAVVATTDRPESLPDHHDHESPMASKEARMSPNHIDHVDNPVGREGCVSPLAPGESPAPHGVFKVSDVAAIYEGGLDPDGFGRSPQLLSDIFPDVSVEMPPDWFDMQDYVLGLDFVNDGAEDSCPRIVLQSSCNSIDPCQCKMHKPTNSGSRAIRLRYYRRLGPTAVVPGFRPLSVIVTHERGKDDHSDRDHTQTEGSPSTGIVSTAGSLSSGHGQLFNLHGHHPHPEVLSAIVPVFFEHFGGHFPWLHPKILSGHVQAGEASNFMLNGLTALSLRFCSLEGRLACLRDQYEVEWRRGVPFLNRAKQHLVTLLNISAPDIVAGFVMLAWAEVGDNNEAGAWMFSGMAIRMAQDLGFHRTPETTADPQLNFFDLARPDPDGIYALTDEQSTVYQQKVRLLLFWCTFVLDVYVSLMTGRAPTLRRSEIETAIPTINDMKLAQLDFTERITMGNMIYPELIAFMLLFSEALEVLNRTSSSHCPLGTSGGVDVRDEFERVERIRGEMLQRYQCLPRELIFTIENYKASMASNQSGVFLTLHLYFYTFLILLSDRLAQISWPETIPHRKRGPPRQDSRAEQQQRMKIHHGGGVDEHQNQQRPQSDMSTMACQKMMQILAIAELVSKIGYLASPFTNHCFFVAASRVLQESQRQRSHDSFISLMAESDYEFFFSKLQEQSKYYATVGSVVTELERQRKVGRRISATAAPEGGIEAECSYGTGIMTREESEDTGVERVIGLEDPGIVTRYTIPRRGVEGHSSNLACNSSPMQS